MAERPEDGELLDRYARAQGRLEHAGGWNWRERVLGPVHGLGFADAELDRRLDSFSGGELTRVARACPGGRPRPAAPRRAHESPRHHVARMARELSRGARLGRDPRRARPLVPRGGGHVRARAGGRAFALLPGSWHAWRKEAAAREIQLGKQIEKQQAEIARMERFIERFRYKATKARQAQSRVKRLDKMERIERAPRDNRSLGFSFGEAERTGRVVLDMAGARVEVPGRTLVEDGELWLERGEHVSLVGPNGAGKTTLIQSLAGRRPLEAGRVKVGHNVQLGYLSQHAEEVGSAGTVLEAAQRATGLTPNKASCASRPIPVQRRRGRQAAGRCVRWRATPPVARDPGCLRLECPDPRRAHEPSRPGRREALEDALSSFGGASCSSRTTAPCSMRSAPEPWHSRTGG